MQTSTATSQEAKTNGASAEIKPVRRQLPEWMVSGYQRGCELAESAEKGRAAIARVHADDFATYGEARMTMAN